MPNRPGFFEMGPKKRPASELAATPLTQLPPAPREDILILMYHLAQQRYLFEDDVPTRP